MRSLKVSDEAFESEKYLIACQEAFMMMTNTTMHSVESMENPFRCSIVHDLRQKCTILPNSLIIRYALRPR